MVAVAEKLPARARFEKLRQALEQRRSALAEAQAEIQRLEQAEKAALGEALTSKPAARAYARGEKPFELRARRERVESSIPGLEDEVAELDRLVEAAVEGAARELVEARVAETGQFAAANVGAWQDFASKYAALFASWLEVVETAERLDEHTSSVLGEELVHLSPATHREVVNAGRFPVLPFPTGFQIALELLNRLAFSLDARRAPVNERLAELVPDLRGLMRAPRLSGRVDTISSTDGPQVRRR